MTYGKVLGMGWKAYRKVWWTIVSDVQGKQTFSVRDDSICGMVFGLLGYRGPIGHIQHVSVL